MRHMLVILVGLLTAILYAAPAGANSVGTHSAITITSNSGFSTCGCVTVGNGSASNPYVIGPWQISSPSNGSKGGWSVKVDNSKGAITAYFNIVGITSSYNDANPSDPDIWLVNIHTTTSINSGTNASSSTSSNNNGTGIRLDNSSNISMDNLSYDKMQGPGVFINGSSYISLNNSKLKSLGGTRPNGDAVYAVNSSNLQFGTGSDCPNNSPCNDTTYDNGFSYDLVNSHDVVINHASASSNDTGGYLFDGSNTYNVTLENSHATGLGPICIKVNGQKVNTGYYTDLQAGLILINGAHSNTFTDDTFNIPGSPPMPSIGSGGNGFYVNACAGFVAQPFSPVETQGANNDAFNTVCYSLPVDYPNLPPSATNCPGS